MLPRFTQTCRDFAADRQAIAAARYGVIEAEAGRVAAIHLRPWPKLISWPEIWPAGPLHRARGQADRCLLYYNQPRRHGRFLALKYVVSTAGTRYETILAAVRALDAVAELKQSDAALCDVFNPRISDRLLARLGWTAHKPQRWHRNFIRRYYGVYPGAWQQLTAR